MQYNCDEIDDKMKNINERENDGQHIYVIISILHKDWIMIMKQHDNDEVSKY